MQNGDSPPGSSLLSSVRKSNYVKYSRNSPRFVLVFTRQSSYPEQKKNCSHIQDSHVAAFRTSNSGWELQEGELIPIWQSENCMIRDGERTFSLLNGKKMCISKKVRVEIPEGNVLYLVWKVRN